MNESDVDSSNSSQNPRELTTATIEELLKDWDGKDLLEAVGLLSTAFPCKTLKDSLQLTEIAEMYQRHHKLRDKSE